MKVKNITITIKDRKEVLKEFAQVLGKARKGEKIPPHEEVSFQNIDALRRVLTEKRIELLHLIRLHHPESIYELAKIANRDLKNVHEDLLILKEVGLLSLEELGDERGRVQPKVEFDTLKIEIAI